MLINIMEQKMDCILWFNKRINKMKDRKKSQLSIVPTGTWNGYINVWSVAFKNIVYENRLQLKKNGIGIDYFRKQH